VTVGTRGGETEDRRERPTASRHNPPQQPAAWQELDPGRTGNFLDPVHQSKKQIDPNRRCVGT
jgi:hypothetical protein